MTSRRTMRSAACALGAPAKDRAPPNTTAARTTLPNMDFKRLLNIASSRASPGLLSGCALYDFKHVEAGNVAGGSQLTARRRSLNRGSLEAVLLDGV